MLNLTELAQVSYEIAADRGWWSKERSFPAMTLLKISEISEALEDYRGNRDLREIFYETPDGTLTFDEAGAEAFREANPEVSLKPCGIPSEVADFVIRIADYFGKYNEDLDGAYRNYVAVTPHPDRYNSNDFENALAFATLRVSKAFETWTRDKEAFHSSEVFHHLAGALQPIFETCKAHQIPLEKAIEVKTAFNRKRPYRHGGKKI